MGTVVAGCPGDQLASSLKAHTIAELRSAGQPLRLDQGQHLRRASAATAWPRSSRDG